LRTKPQGDIATGMPDETSIKSNFGDGTFEKGDDQIAPSEIPELLEPISSAIWPKGI